MKGGGKYAGNGGKGGSLQGQGGFTLIEAIVVMAVMVVLSVVAVGVLWSSLTTYQFNAATARVLNDIRYAQQQARVRNGWYGIQFQTGSASTYHVYWTDGSTDTDVASPVNPSTTLTVNLDSEYSVGISAVSIGGGDKVEFSPMGVPYLDKTGAALTSAGTITLTAGGSNRVIQVLAETGRAEVQ